MKPKVLLLIAALALTLGFVSCSKDGPLAVGKAFEKGGIYYIVTSDDGEVEASGPTAVYAERDDYGNIRSSQGSLNMEYYSGRGEITIPATVKYKGNTYSVTAVGEYAFCYGDLTKVTIPATVVSIGAFAFWLCSNLKEVFIPDSVTLLTSGAFQECVSLEKIYSMNPEPPTCYLYGHFYDVPTDTCILYVPSGSKEAYSTAKGWQDFENIVEVE